MNMVTFVLSLLALLVTTVIAVLSVVHDHSSNGHVTTKGRFLLVFLGLATVLSICLSVNSVLDEQAKEEQRTLEKEEQVKQRNAELLEEARQRDVSRKLHEDELEVAREAREAEKRELLDANTQVLIEVANILGRVEATAMSAEGTLAEVLATREPFKPEFVAIHRTLPGFRGGGYAAGGGMSLSEMLGDVNGVAFENGKFPDALAANLRALGAGVHFRVSDSDPCGPQPTENLVLGQHDFSVYLFYHGGSDTLNVSVSGYVGSGGDFHRFRNLRDLDGAVMMVFPGLDFGHPDAPFGEMEVTISSAKSPSIVVSSFRRVQCEQYAVFVSVLKLSEIKQP